MRKRVFESLRFVILIDELAREIVGIGLHVEMPVAAQIEQDGRRFPFLPRFQRFIDRRADRMGCFRGRHDAFRAGELNARLEARVLVVSPRLDQPELLAVADQRRHAVIAQAAGMEAGRDKLRSQRMHLDEGSEMSGVAEVERIFAMRQAAGSTAITRTSCLSRSFLPMNGKAMPAKFEPPPAQPITMSGKASARST